MTRFILQYETLAHIPYSPIYTLTEWLLPTILIERELVVNDTLKMEILFKLKDKIQISNKKIYKPKRCT